MYRSKLIVIFSMKLLFMEVNDVYVGRNKESYVAATT